jgi:hypothetical protein
MWRLFDFKTVQKFEGDIYLSVMVRDEYDCEEETGRVLDFYWYSGNMRGGEVVESATNLKKEAESILPGSIDETLFNIACDKK